MLIIIIKLYFNIYFKQKYLNYILNLDFPIINIALITYYSSFNAENHVDLSVPKDMNYKKKNWFYMIKDIVVLIFIYS